MSNELKPCPCCSSKRTNESYDEYNVDDKIFTSYNISCSDCSLSIRGNDKKHAYERWNTRPENPLQERVKELENGIAKIKRLAQSVRGDSLIQTADLKPTDVILGIIHKLTTPQDIKDKQ